VTERALDRWLEEIVATPGMTGLRSADDARRVLLDDALRALSLLDANPGPVVDVGSGGGSPGVPLAAARPERSITLLESERRKCEFLRKFTEELPNLAVVWGRAEEQPVDTFGVALAKALATPPVAAELCVPLVRVGGIAVLWTGATADEHAVARVVAQLGGHVEEAGEGLLVIRKTAPTPAGFPRRAGMARKRPLG
jgi:16S rRNA (guanine527-N7)-methyltransferase